MNRVIVGIDISKKKFDAAYMIVNQKWQRGTFENAPEGYKDLLKWLGNNRNNNVGDLTWRSTVLLYPAFH